MAKFIPSVHILKNVDLGVGFTKPETSNWSVALLSATGNCIRSHIVVPDTIMQGDIAVLRNYLNYVLHIGHSQFDMACAGELLPAQGSIQNVTFRTQPILLALPRLVVKHAILVNLQPMIGEIIKVWCNYNDPVIVLKKAILESKHVLVSNQFLKFRGEQLLNNITLHDYGITHDSTVDIYIRTTPNLDYCMYVDFDAKPISIRKPVEGDVLWRSLFPGLCIEVYCTNFRCAAFEQIVIVNKGLGSYDSNKHGQGIRCPVCKDYGVPFAYAFNRCKYRWFGVRRIRRPGHLSKSYCASLFKSVEKKYVRLNNIGFNKETEDGCSWILIKIITVDFHVPITTISERVPPMDINGEPSPVHCPITMEIMSDPVMASDGFSYQRRSIKGWLRYTTRSPITNEHLESQLVDNYNLKRAISRWMVI